MSDDELTAAAYEEVIGSLPEYRQRAIKQWRERVERELAELRRVREAGRKGLLDAEGVA